MAIYFNFFPYLVVCFLITTSITAIDLLPPPQSPGLTVTNGEGGAYYVWTAAQFPLLSQAKLGAGLLILHPRGFAIPHYADSNKIGFVVDGIGKIGILLPNSTTEIVLAVKKGDTIAVPLGAVSWYYGAGPTSDLVIIFLGETSQSYTPGIFDYFFLAGTNGILGGFSNDIISKTYNFTSTEANSLTKSQTGTYIVKLRNGQNLPNPSNISSAKILSYNLENAKPDLLVNNGGSLTTATAQNFPILNKIGLSAGLINLYNDSLLTPQFTVDSSNQLIYVTNGSGRIQIVGLNGQNVLDANAQKGQLFIVPKFFIAAKLAGEGGLKYINVVTSSNPTFTQLAGPTAISNLESPLVTQAAFNLNSQFTNCFISKLENGSIILPPIQEVFPDN